MNTTVSILLKSGRLVRLDLEQRDDLVFTHDYWCDHLRGFVSSALVVGRRPHTDELIFIPSDNIELIRVEKE